MVIGLTGGIGSGKTTVLHFFEELGVQVFIADIEAKKLMNCDVELISQIQQLFGAEAYRNGVLNRKFIASKVFNNANKLAALNALVHPKVRQHFIDFKSKFSKAIIIYEAAILFESGSHKLCDYIITVTADLNTRISRIMERDSVSKNEILDRMQHQLQDEFKIKNANFVIRNNNLKDTKIQVYALFTILKKLNK